MRAPCGNVLLAVVLLFGDGCSVLFVKRPPPGPLEPQPPVECTTSVAAPVVDTVLAAGSLTGGILMATDKCSPSGFLGSLCTAEKAGGAGLIAAGVALAAVGIYGYLATGECRGVHETQLACVSGVESSCLTLKERGAVGPPQAPDPSPSAPPSQPTP